MELIFFFYELLLNPITLIVLFNVFLVGFLFTCLIEGIVNYFKKEKVNLKPKFLKLFLVCVVIGGIIISIIGFYNYLNYEPIPTFQPQEKEVVTIMSGEANKAIDRTNEIIFYSHEGKQTGKDVKSLIASTYSIISSDASYVYEPNIVFYEMSKEDNKIERKCQTLDGNRYTNHDQLVEYSDDLGDINFQVKIENQYLVVIKTYTRYHNKCVGAVGIIYIDNMTDEEINKVKESIEKDLPNYEDEY